jgi:c-di-GMP-binding flagellar brake protein YcgR
MRPETRRFARTPVSLPVSFAVFDDPPAPCEANDIGGGGMRIALEREYDPGTLMIVRFRLPGGEREIVARGKVVMSFYNGQEKRYMHGLAFTQIDPADQQSIVRFVEAAIAR